MGETEDERTAQASVLFENFVKASTCKGTLQAFGILCRQLELDPLDYNNFYSSLKAAISTWKVKALWAKLDKRAQHKVYNQNKACQGTMCLIIGGGPCGLRTAIELALLGCKVVVIEKRDTFSRNNVLHLWPFTIHDLKSLGAKKFYGKFCAGSIDHISIRQLQLMLMKVSLILGVEIHVNVEFVKLVEPPAEQTDSSPGWRAEVRPSSHLVSNYDFDVVIGADGRKNTLDGFGRKEFRGKLAIAITANFVNRNTTAEAKVEEISGVASIFNQKFFLELKEETGIDLENIVYYKDNTHYFVMTAKKQSLLDKGVIINDYMETERLLRADNVNQEALLSYAREAADFGTNYQLPSLDYAINHYGQPDVTMFDFTSMYASENAALIREKHGHQLLVALVGDSLLEPFWPMGTGCARGFLAAFDSAWMVRGWAQGRSPLEILAERESIYRLLPQTTTENISKNFEQYTIDPATRYPNLNSSCVRPHQVRHLFIDSQQDLCHLERGGPTRRSVNLSRRESEVHPGRLLTWCQKQTQGYRGVNVINLTSSWRSGLAFCALIHRQRPELIDYDSLNEEDMAGNNQLAFDLAEQEFGIQPVTRGNEMAAEAEPDKLLMVLYLSKFYEAFWNSPEYKNGSREPHEIGEGYLAENNHKLLNLPQPKKRIPRDDKKLEDNFVNKRRRKGNHFLTGQLSCHSVPSAGEDGELRENKVRSMATQLLAKFEENSSTAKSVEEPFDPYFSPPLSPSTTAHPLLKEEEEEEEDQEKKDNPRFAKPKNVPPPPPQPSPQPKWQPSIYLRLLENPSAVAQQTTFLYSPASSYPQSGYSHSPSPIGQLSPPRSPSPNVTEHYYTECTSPDVTNSHIAASTLSVLDIGHSLERSEESMQKQSKAQGLSTKEFYGRSIKERAVLLSSMFPGSNKPPASLSETKVELSTPSLPSLSPPPPPSAYVSKSSLVYPVVHPVPDPTAQAGFSSVPLYSAGHMDKIHKDSSTPSSYTNSLSKNGQISCLVVDSSTCNNPTYAAHFSTCSDENQESSSAFCDSDCENGHSSLAPSLLHKGVYERMHESSRNNLESEKENVQKTQKTFNYKKLAASDQMKCNGSCVLENPKGITQKSIVRSESCPTGAACYIKERTVGKVSSAIDAKAQILAVLYETDHRPNATPCVVRKDLPPGLGGSDICHFCTKRVYVMERLSAEGYFFHRECFRCDICNSTLRLGGHIFDSQEGKFYCKMHYAQHQSSTYMGRFRRRMDNQSCGTPSSLDRGSYATGSVQIQPPGGASSLRSELDEGQKGVPEDTEMAIEALEASCVVRTTAQDTAGVKGQSKDSCKDYCNTKPSNQWKRKIRATFPLIFIKHFQKSWPPYKEGPETVPEADSDFEEITLAGKETNSDGSSKTSAEKSEEHSVTIKTVCNLATPKKRLMLSLSEKEKLLNWDLLVTPDETTVNTNTKNKHQHKDKVQAETEADKLQTDWCQNMESSQSQTSAPSPSAFQLLANAFRRTFSVTNPSSRTNTAVTMRTKRDGHCKQRPKSEGVLSSSSLLSTMGLEPSTDEKKAGKRKARGASAGADPWGAGQDLPSLLQQVSIKGSSHSGGVFTDDMASLTGKSVNLFSSLSLRKREESESEGQDQEVQKILINLRTKASKKQNLEEPSSSDDENENLTSNQKLCPARQKRKQEKTVAQQAKRELLKRLHRAQAIQRQLEEVSEKQRNLEERGVAIEKIIRGETESSQTDDEAQLYQSWFKLVLEKNKLARFESELMIFAQELELEDTQSQLQQDLRHRMAIEDTKKSASELQEEQEILSEIMKTVEKRDMLVSILEEQRLKEKAEDRDLESLVLSKGYEFHWAQADESWGQAKLE
ncbi:protein-methionine sulfoxide oxidase mical2b isoform X1 [Etheostoma spectabile]|uniref:protein-methionine sulfoxide oxidase mical2b isoform X1 n=1 Tax=Etheostoma spectabile TaxID=54343 RepID=UPI0013AFB0B1|nr:protein-methionine sulfoxide oxidase mical2b-like isoform X1 [Etheostoma spectabile]XP_032367630.1 protein-methionine sulfoxide oxidase mical2b-like isoform X1 [Etheostoma spectabile]XP_032367631.1 protein-methionine sulfoxide oxidase mical2b-like isoform X1 [Etheostoma spectabile]